LSTCTKILLGERKMSTEKEKKLGAKGQRPKEKD
jgi:hypothetical protein